MTIAASRDQLVVATAEIVGAHVARNSLAIAELPLLVRRVYASLASRAAASATPQITLCRIELQSGDQPYTSTYQKGVGHTAVAPACLRSSDGGT